MAAGIEHLGEVPAYLCIKENKTQRAELGPRKPLHRGLPSGELATQPEPVDIKRAGELV